VLKSDILSIPDCLVPERSYTLSRAIAGIQLVPGEGKKGRLGDVSQLRPGSVLEFCGKGYDARKMAGVGGSSLEFTEFVLPEE
jgi:hypothetical protein